jgi:hypothetical protein
MTIKYKTGVKLTQLRMELKVFIPKKKTNIKTVKLNLFLSIVDGQTNFVP